MKLPPVLAPWATYLGLFAPPLDAALGALVKRLDHVFGPVESAYSTDSDEPEGYDGIARRGSYERLLISEWLLAEELPDEFLRRSANNEQAFLELARKSPSGNRTIVALFDCGPNQFGSPRVVHLAMLIILARRADSCGAQLKWGILQDREETELFDGLSVSGIEKLMRTRKFTEAVAADISAWSSSLGLEWKNAWIAGGNRTMRLLTRQPVARLQIDDILEPAARAVFVRYTQPGRRQMEFNLNLPDEQHCAQLLRNPFSTTAATMRASRINLPEQDSSIIMHNGMEYFLWRSSVLSHVYALRAPRHIKGGVIKQRTYQASTNRPVIAAAIKVNAQAANFNSSAQRRYGATGKSWRL